MVRLVAMLSVAVCLPLMAQRPPQRPGPKKERPRLKKSDPLLRQIMALRKQLETLKKRLDALRKKVEGIVKRRALKRPPAPPKHHPKKPHLRKPAPAHKPKLPAHPRRPKRHLRQPAGHPPHPLKGVKRMRGRMRHPIPMRPKAPRHPKGMLKRMPHLLGKRLKRMRGVPPWLQGRDGQMLRRFARRKIFFRRAMMLRRFLQHIRQLFIKRLQERIGRMRRFKPRITPEDIRHGFGLFIRRMLQEKLRRRIPPTVPQAAWF